MRDKHGSKQTPSVPTHIPCNVLAGMARPLSLCDVTASLDAPAPTPTVATEDRPSTMSINASVGKEASSFWVPGGKQTVCQRARLYIKARKGGIGSRGLLVNKNHSCV